MRGASFILWFAYLDLYCTELNHHLAGKNTFFMDGPLILFLWCRQITVKVRGGGTRSCLGSYPLNSFSVREEKRVGGILWNWRGRLRDVSTHNASHHTRKRWLSMWLDSPLLKIVSQLIYIFIQFLLESYTEYWTEYNNVKYTHWWAKTL